MNALRRLLAGLGLALLIPAFAFAQITITGAGKAPGGGGGGGGGSPPAYAWVYGGDITTGNTSATTSSNGQSISSGDTLVIVAAVNDYTNTDHAMACPSGWTTASGFPDFDNGSNSGINVLLCSKVAGGSETGAYTVTWTTNNTFAGVWTLFKFTGANASGPVEASGVTRNGSSSNSTSTVTPTVTSSGSNRLFVSCSQNYATSQTFTTPAGMTLAFTTTGLNAYRLACATLAVGSGATGTATWTLGSTTRSAGISFILKP